MSARCEQLLRRCYGAAWLEGWRAGSPYAAWRAGVLARRDEYEYAEDEPLACGWGGKQKTPL